MEDEKLVPYKNRGFFQRLFGGNSKLDAITLENFFKSMKKEEVRDIVPEDFVQDWIVPELGASHYINYLVDADYKVEYTSEKNGTNRSIEFEQETLLDYDMSYPVTHCSIKENGQYTKATTFLGTELLQVILAARINHGEEAYADLMEAALDRLPRALDVGASLESNLSQIRNKMVVMRLMKKDKNFKQARKEFDKLSSEKARYDKTKRSADILNQKRFENEQTEQNDFISSLREVPSPQLQTQQNTPKSMAEHTTEPKGPDLE